ncbi:MAG: hypothetical protein J1E83_05120 [Lachnospiraceae bacterium]|nr:hypothetical protein [Lachnospiraceae bacterium]
MKEQLYMIPLNDAVHAEDECPFCYIERQIEQDLLDFVLGSGSSYMESDVREQTDKHGFCRTHFKKMFEYGNTLGNGWILKTHYKRMIEEFNRQIKSYTPGRVSLKDKFRKDASLNPVSAFIKEKETSCYICNYYKEHYDRYLDTFFVMYKKDEDFRSRIQNGKGFCLPHFGDLCAAMETKLSDSERSAFYAMLCELMQRNLNRLSEDVSWLIEKFDYLNKDADWKNSRDAVQRGMQKLKGGYPAEPPYKMNK